MSSLVRTAAALAISATAIHADTYTHTFSTSDCKAGTVTVTINRPGVIRYDLPVEIPRAMTATEKRDFIVEYMDENYPYRIEALGDNQFQMFSGGDGTTEVSFSTGDTAEEKDSIVALNTTLGAITFSGFFDPFESPGLPAIFTAGIVTEVGELTVAVSAQELNFQTDGPIICQALFQRLAPQAPHYGAAINCVSDRLEVYFDPAYYVTVGVTFGTTSPTPGCTGMVIAPPTNDCPDINYDGVVDLGDLAVLLANYGLIGATYEQGDVDGDLDVDLSDLSELLAEYGRVCP